MHLGKQFFWLFAALIATSTHRYTGAMVSQPRVRVHPEVLPVPTVLIVGGPVTRIAMSTRQPRSKSQWLRDVVLRRLERGQSLPVLPAAAAELMVLMGRDTADARQLSDVIHRDPALAAHVLRVANTAAYRGVTTIVSLQQAVARLGLALINEIALSVSVKGSVFDVQPHGHLARELWRTSYATALVAKEIARETRQNVEAAFLCGLLHDFGAPVVLRTAILAAEAIGAQTSDRELVEMMEELSPVVGGHIAERWEMPARVCAAVRFHRAFHAVEAHRYDAALTAMARAVADHFLDPDSDELVVREHPAVVELHLYDDEIDTLLGRREAIERALSAVTA